MSLPPRIPDFFAGRHVLVTGGTGFMGKVLLEKLLRSCPDIGAIYLLLRPKRGKEPQSRLQDVMNVKLFDTLKEQRPGLAERVVVIVPGDVSMPGLGLSEEHRALLRDKVSVIFHGAATVRFDEPLTTAVPINVRGTYELAELALGMEKLVVLVHFSTTYCNTDRKVIDEMLYPPHADWRKLIKAAETIDRYELDIITPKLLAGLPNTYTFSKSLGEHCIASYQDRLPIVILRPSIVISSLKDPVAGWIDNFHGPVGLMVAAGKGLVHAAMVDTRIVADYMPVDIAIKVVIVAAWERATAKEARSALDVYNCSSSTVKPVTMAEMINMGREVAPDIPFDDLLWPPQVIVTTSRTMLLVYTLVLHMVPAVFLDLALRLKGQKPWIWRLQRRIFAAQDALGPFLTTTWVFKNNRGLALSKTIRPDDLDDFDFDYSDVDEKAYFKDLVIGARRYLLNEPDEKLPLARQRYARLLMAESVLRLTVLVVFIYTFFYLELYTAPIKVLSYIFCVPDDYRRAIPVQIR